MNFGLVLLNTIGFQLELSEIKLYITTVATVTRAIFTKLTRINYVVWLKKKHYGGCYSLYATTDFASTI